MGDDVIFRIDMPRKVGVCFGIQAVAWAGILCLISEKGCGKAGDIIGDVNSLTLVVEETGKLVLLELALLPRKDRCQPCSCSQEESWACSKKSS